MIFQLQQNNLNKALQICSRALSDNNILPVNSMYLFSIEYSVLTISSCDMRIIISTSLPVLSDPIKICIPGRKLADYIAKSANELMTFEVVKTTEREPDNERLNETVSISLTVKSGKNNTAKFNCEDGDEFPRINNIDSRSFELPASDFLEALNKTMFAISDDQLRPSATGLSVSIRPGTVEFASLDFNMVASCSYQSTLDFESDFIIPKKSLQQIQSLNPVGTLQMSISKTAISINFSDIKTTSRLIDERFPDYKAITPTDNNIDFLTSRSAMIASLKRILPFSDIGKMVRLNVSQNSLLLTAENIDYSEEANETIDGILSEHDGIIYEHHGILIGANGEFLLNILNSLSDDKIWFSFSTPRRAMIITQGEKHVNPSKENLVLLMPLFIS